MRSAGCHHWNWLGSVASGPVFVTIVATDDEQPQRGGALTVVGYPLVVIVH